MSERLILSWMMQDRDGWQPGRLWQPAMSHRVSHTKVDALLTWLPALPPFSADLKAQGSRRRAWDGRAWRVLITCWDGAADAIHEL